jgi:integrase
VPLSDIRVRNAKPNAKPSTKRRRMFDSNGLYVEISPAGGKWWRLKYRLDGKDKRLSLGTYPEVSLKEARDRRDEARKLLRNGVDPAENRKALNLARAEGAANTFEAVTGEWLAKFSPTWAAGHAFRIRRLFERDVFPWIGARPIAAIAAPELLAVIRRIEARGALETAHRALGTLSTLFRFAVATGRIHSDPARDLRGALPPAQAGHFAAVTDPKRLGTILCLMDGYTGTLPVVCALRLAPLLFVRPGELRTAEWKDVDLDAAEWRYRVTKTGVDHIVPLSRQALKILRQLHALTGQGRLLFPGARGNGRPMSDAAVIEALRRLGIPKEEMSGHGFRAVARTIMDEVLGVRPDFIEHQLAHAVRDPLGRAYNRTAHLAERHTMMQRWADYLDELKSSAQVNLGSH